MRALVGWRRREPVPVERSEELAGPIVADVENKASMVEEAEEFGESLL